jgi:hypothetical protein
MHGRTTPLAERPDWHPVHRANALLEAAMLSTAHAEPFEDQQSVESLSRAIASVMDGPVEITYPVPLSARLDALAAADDGYPSFDLMMESAPWRDPLEPTDDAEQGALCEDGAAWDETLAEPDPEADACLRAEVPLDPDRQIAAPQLYMQSLLHEFHRRQRHASLLVAGSIATAAALTLGGLVLIATWTTPHPGGSQPAAVHSTSVVWQKPAAEPARIAIAAVAPNRGAKGEPLLKPTLIGEAPAATGAATQVILAASGREIAFGPLLPSTHARYLLIRGLPPGSKLSAGRDSGSGAWLVKTEYLSDLKLVLGGTPVGDYPLEVYMLDSGDGPQARRNFVLRVAPPANDYAARTGKTWTSALLDVVPSAHAAEPPTAPADPTVLRDRAAQLLGIGDIAGARLLLLHLAERGDGEAAYQLARTFDREMLAELGARGLDGDLAQARGWYERASRDGNAKAAERLKILASLSGTGPSD